MQTSPNGIRFIEQNEGFQDQVYNDNGRLCIGYGHDILPGESFPGWITVVEAEELLLNDLKTRFEPSVNRLAPHANQNQFNALVDFVYNLGPWALMRLLSHGWDEVSYQLPLWCHKHVDGVVVEDAGLKARRTKEVDLFNTPVA